MGFGASFFIVNTEGKERGGVGQFSLKINGQDGKNTAHQAAARAEGG
jgi:hypothetical protein